MSPIRQSKRPAPDAYDYLWSLLPVFVVFLAVLVFAAAVGDRPLLDSTAVDPESPSAATAATGSQRVADPTVPSAAEALAAQANVAAEPVATF